MKSANRASVRETGKEDLPLSPQRAFVVQFRERGNAKQEPFTGRAEHMPSGQTQHFASAEELVTFIMHVLATIQDRSDD